MKRLEWTIPVLVDLGSARRMSFGDFDTQQGLCHKGTGAHSCNPGNSVIEE